MATRRHCPNCEDATRGRSLHRCKRCAFIGCYKSDFLESSGCWKDPECPRCGSTAGSEPIGYIGDYDSN